MLISTYKDAIVWFNGVWPLFNKGLLTYLLTYKIRCDWSVWYLRPRM